MKRSLLVMALLLCVTQSYTQNILKGYVNKEEDRQGIREITLIRLVPGEDYKAGEMIAKVSVDKDGSFVFPDSVFTQKDEIYKVQVEISSPSKKLLDTTINEFKSFILSNRDSLRFGRENSNYIGYTNTNNADREWQKLKKYEQQIAINEYQDPEHYLSETRTYTKDSLEILLVKLLSIQTLDEKQLLDRDIKENAEFYLELLDKLKESDLEPSSYAYLENKIRMTHQEIINRKYHLSLALNFFGFSGIIGLLILVFRMQKKGGTESTVKLSKQEEKIKNLILEGKTNKEIAADLFISISTVKTHTSNIYSKLMVSNRKDLMFKLQNHTGTST